MACGLGNTATNLALDMLREQSYAQNRSDAPDIAIVVTDGLSTSPDLTVVSSQNVKDEKITVFAIGMIIFRFFSDDYRLQRYEANWTNF